jgi:hypothetical protein
MGFLMNPFISSKGKNSISHPAMINNHFGNTPMFGTIEKMLRVEK